MKKIKRLYRILPLFLIVISTACLEDEGYNDLIEGENEKGAVSFFGNYAGVVPNFILPQPEPQQTSVVVTYSAAKPATGNIEVKVNVKESLVADFNVKNRTAFQALDKTYYEISPSVNIKENERDAKLFINIKNADALYDSLTYLLPLEITEASGRTIGANLKTSYMLFRIKK